MDAKEVMKNLLVLVSEEVLAMDSFVLYWFFWANYNKVHNRKKMAKVIGKRSLKTVTRYLKQLKDFRLIKIELENNGKGCEGFKASTLKVDNEKMKYINGIFKKVETHKKIKNKRNSELIDIVRKYIPEKYKKGGYTAPHIKMLLQIDSLFDFEDYIKWFSLNKLSSVREKTIDGYALSWTLVKEEYKMYILSKSKSEAFKNTAGKKSYVSDDEEELLLNEV